MDGAWMVRHLKEDASFLLTWLRDHLHPDRLVRILCAPRLAAQHQSVLSQERGEFIELSFRRARIGFAAYSQHDRIANTAWSASERWAVKHRQNLPSRH